MTCYSHCSSHAHEEDLPGTVNLQALEGDDTAYGQALYPVPSDDPNDPLQWPKSKKMMILILCSLYSFLGNSALVGPSVYLEIYAKEFGISVTEASGLVSYPNLVYGFGRLCQINLSALQSLTVQALYCWCLRTSSTDGDRSC
jgi:hypothetical protein